MIAGLIQGPIEVRVSFTDRSPLPWMTETMTVRFATGRFLGSIGDSLAMATFGSEEPDIVGWHVPGISMVWPG